MFHSLPIIANPAGAKMSERKILDGILHSTLLTATQRQYIDGIVHSVIPGAHSVHPKIKVSASATKGVFGTMHAPGSKY